MKPKLLVIDNYDSFTYNLVQMFIPFSLEIIVKRADKITITEAAALKPDYLLISPGPKDPAHAGISKESIAYFYDKIPILGVCLGMQCLNEVFGGKTKRAPVPVHGKTDKIYHRGDGIFKRMPLPFAAARYHSLIIEPAINAPSNDPSININKISDKSVDSHTAKSSDDDESLDRIAETSDSVTETLNSEVETGDNSLVERKDNIKAKSLDNRMVKSLNKALSECVNSSIFASDDNTNNNTTKKHHNPAISITAWNNQGLIMGVELKGFSTYGVQFHPESFMTENGIILIQNFIDSKDSNARE